MGEMNINDGEMESRILRHYLTEELAGYAVEGDPAASKASSLCPLNEDTDEPRVSTEKPRKRSKKQ